MLLSWVLHLLIYTPILVHTSPVDLPAPLPTAAPEGNILQFDDEPGETPEAEQDDYYNLSLRGKDYWDKLAETLLDPNARDKTDGCLKFDEFYKATFDYREEADDDWMPLFEKYGIDPTFLDVWITTDHKPRSEWEDHPYKNAFNTRDGVIVAKENFKKDDKVQELNWSELIYHTWHRAAKRADRKFMWCSQEPVGGPLSNLQTVIQSSVVNGKTTNVLGLMYKRRGLKPPESEQWVRWTEDEFPAFWLALMGSDNVKGTVYLLRDHAQELGRKIITEVWTLWDTSFPDIW
ncbi:MAG: hypothetical protein Q9221_006735 [Calogaya cf. arnoldii]